MTKLDEFGNKVKKKKKKHTSWTTHRFQVTTE